MNDLIKILWIVGMSLIFISCNNTKGKNEPVVIDRGVFYPSVLKQDIDLGSEGKLDIMHIEKVFQDKLPDELLEISGSNCNYEFSEVGSTYLVIPKAIHKNESLHIDLYGCWIDSAFYVDLGISYKGFFVNVSDNTVLFEAQQITWNDPEAPAIQEKFLMQHSEDINGTWNSGELIFKVKNPNGEYLISTIAINE